MAEFQWWLLLVGLVAGGGLVALVLMDSARREQDVEAEEIPAEATWIAERMRAHGRRVDPSDVEEVLLQHREYLASPPPDVIVSPADGPPAAIADATGAAPTSAMAHSSGGPTPRQRARD
jgi:hypothetical protein